MTTENEKPSGVAGAPAAEEETTKKEVVPGEEGEGSSPQQEKKKRGAGADFRGRDDAESDDDDEGGAKGDGTWNKADQETLSKRRIVKARRPPGFEERESTAAGSKDEAPPAANPFSGISLTASAGGGGGVASSTTTTSSFGFGTASSTNIFAKHVGGESKSAFGSFGGAAGSSVGFASYKLTNPFSAALPGASSSSSTANPFASSPSKTNPFEMRADSKSYFGGGGGGGEGGGFALGGGDDEGGDGAVEDLEAEPNVTFDVPKVHGLKDANYKPITGEEDWTCVLQSRCKVYKLMVIKQSSSSSSPGKAANGSSSSADANVKRDWVEAGVGMAKILEKEEAAGGGKGGRKLVSRVVFRREPGTAVTINLYLKEPVEAAKHAEKALRITCIEEQGQPATYVMRFKVNDEMETMLTEMQKRIKAAG